MTAVRSQSQRRPFWEEKLPSDVTIQRTMRTTSSISARKTVNMTISDTYLEKSRRYSLSKRRRERFSTVTISDLTEDDTGTYWCGVETSRTEQRYITLITQVKLLVIS
ncbi:unnamed protein product, partial [Oncorhynchus mykiss]